MKLHVPKGEGVPLSENNKKDDSTEEPKESKFVRVVPASNSLTGFQTKETSSIDKFKNMVHSK